MLLFGTHEEIAAGGRCRAAGHKAAAVPSGGTSRAPSAGDDLAFELHTLEPTQADDRDGLRLGPQRAGLPPLPQKLTAAQAARLAEIFDFLHRGLTVAAENIQANEDGSEVRLGFADWQTIQAVQMFLARYLRAVAEPEPPGRIGERRTR